MSVQLLRGVFFVALFGRKCWVVVGCGRERCGFFLWLNVLRIVRGLRFEARVAASVQSNLFAQ